MVKVSIIVPIFNVQNYLRECLNSILCQSLRDIEIICVNDGSTDHSLEIMEEYERLDSRVKILNKENTGYGASMNQGIRASSGEYIGIVEPDDFVEPGMYEELYKKANKCQLDWIKGNFQVFKGSGNERRNAAVKVSLLEESELYGKVIHPSDYPELIVYDDFHWKGIYKKEFLSRNGILFHETPGAAYQDNGFKYQTICMAERVMYIENTYYWYRRDNPLASTYNAKGLELMYGEYQFIKGFMKKNLKRTSVFCGVYYKKLYLQFQDQLNKILDKEWEEVQPERILELYKREFLSGIQEGYLSKGQVDEGIYYDIRFLLRYAKSYFEYKKVQKELGKEGTANWINTLKGKKVVVVCGGAKARQLINFLESNHLSCIVAVCDNNKSQWTKMLYDFPIISTEQAVKEYPKEYFLIAKAGEVQELRKQLMELGIQEENIGDIPIRLSGFLSLTCVV